MQLKENSGIVSSNYNNINETWPIREEEAMTKTRQLKIIRTKNNIRLEKATGRQFVKSNKAANIKIINTIEER